MLPIIDLIATVGGLIIPPAFDFIKKKFVKRSDDTPEATLSSLATTKPEIMPAYLEALVKWNDSQKEMFNRDVIGSPSQWVVNLRAAIRPIGVAFAMIILVTMVILIITGNIYTANAVVTGLASAIASDPTLTGVRLTCETMVSSWFGHRISISND